MVCAAKGRCVLVSNCRTSLHPSCDQLAFCVCERMVDPPHTEAPAANLTTRGRAVRIRRGQANSPRPKSGHFIKCTAGCFFRCDKPRKPVEDFQGFLFPRDAAAPERFRRAAADPIRFGTRLEHVAVFDVASEASEREVRTSATIALGPAKILARSMPAGLVPVSLYACSVSNTRRSKVPLSTASRASTARSSPWLWSDNPRLPSQWRLAVSESERPAGNVSVVAVLVPNRIRIAPVGSAAMSRR